MTLDPLLIEDPPPPDPPTDYTSIGEMGGWKNYLTELATRLRKHKVSALGEQATREIELAAVVLDMFAGIDRLVKWLDTKEMEAQNELG